MMNNQPLTKRERYLQRKQEKQKKKELAIKKKKIKKIVYYIILGVIIIALISLIVNYFTGKNYGTPKLEITEMEYDAGTISMVDGPITHSYEIKNAGEGDLKISEMKTSCMCTTAVLKIADKTSPEFGMHDNPALWSQIIAPGETGYIEVTFDPAFHGPQATGPVVRGVDFITNDPQNQKVRIKLMADVTK